MNTEGTACPFKKGDRIDIPKGTLLYERSWGHRQPEAKYTSRKSTVTITNVALEKDWREYLSVDQRAAYDAKQKADSDHYRTLAEQVKVPNSPYWDLATRTPRTPSKEEITEHDAAYEKRAKVWEEHRIADEKHNREYQDLATSQAKLEDFVISWSGGDTHANLVTLSTKPSDAKKLTPPNKRQLMVPGSKWKITQDVTIQYDINNPVYMNAVAAWHQANPRPELAYWKTLPNGSAVHISYTQAQRAAHDQQYKAWHASFEAMKKALEKTTPPTLKADYVEFKAGDILEVDGKFQSYWRANRIPMSDYISNVAILNRASDDSTHGVEYKQISDFIEAESIPMVKVYVLRHKTSGQYFKSFDWQSSRGREGYIQEMADTFMKGKKWDNLGKAKTSILMMSGYYEGLPGADESLPEWGGGQSMSREQLEEYDLVEFNKLDRQEIGLAEGFHEWFKRSWELRELTVRYGSSVRTTYKALEKANLLDTQKGMIVFTVTNEEALDKVGYWGDKTALTDEDKAEIELATASMKKGTFKKAIDSKSMAVSFPNKAAAMMFKLSYNGNLKVSVIDLEDMKEAVDG